MHKAWSLLFGVVMLAAAMLFVIAPVMGWWLPRNVSSYGGGVDALYYLILGMTGFFFVLTEAILVYNIFKFGAAEPGQKAQYVHGNHRLEVFWTAIPAALLVLIAVLQIRTWADIKYQSSMPDPDQVFEVSARQFEWRLRYPTKETAEKLVGAWKADAKAARKWADDPQADDVHVVNEIHTWKDAKVRLYLKTKDVLHSFYLPNLRLKQDALPGKTIPVWFQVTEANTVYDEALKTWVDGRDETGKANPDFVWDLACAELCGWGHYKMQGRLYVHKDKEDYLNWLKQAQESQKRHMP